MSRKFIAAVLAVSTAIAGFSAAPARAASEEDIARLLAGAATIFIIGKAIQSSRDNDSDDKKKVVTHYKPDHGKGPQVQYFDNPRYDRPNNDRSLPKVVPRDAKQHHRDALPAQCVRRIEGGHVNRVVMGRCLERNDVSLRTLPKACRMKVETRRGTARAYALPCLRHRGYTLARN